MTAVSLRHREKVLAHAEERLLSRGELNSAELIALYKKFLRIEEHRLRLKHHADGGGRLTCGLRASLVDIVLRHLLAAALLQNNVDGKKAGCLSLVAIGGYGRGELNPLSDVDVMFLVEDSRKGLPKALNEAIGQILYMLWDIGFKVGHSTRSIPQAIKQANADMQSKTSLLEARLVSGDRLLFDQFRERFVKDCVEPCVKEYLADRVKNQTERHEKHGRTVYMQEPNIKNGCGGLRDYQNLIWMSFFKFRVESTAGLVEKKFCSEAERRRLDRAYDFLLRVRTELHYLNQRAADVIVLGQQLAIANQLGYTQKSVLRRTEAFMRDYYHNARDIYNLTEILSERMAFTPPTPEREPGLLGFLGKRKRPRIDHFDEFYSANGLLCYESSDLFTQDPPRLMRLFQHLQQRNLGMSADLQHAVRRRLHLVDRTFQYAKATRETFMAICSRKGEVGRILRAMHEVDFLGRYIPEFGQLTCLVQHEFFHRYTADEHTLVCIEKLDRLVAATEPRLAEYQKIFLKLEDPLILYLAILLHDTGKGTNAHNHAEASAVFAARVARRLQLAPEQRKSLVLLVDHHILLSMTAQRRNLDDPATIAEFATLVKSQANLDMLMLLTLADGQGTGDENWSDWKETLVWQLYHGASLYLSDGEAFYRQRTFEREELRRYVRKKLAADLGDEIEAHFECMPDRYFQMHKAPDIAEHIRLFRQFLTDRLETNANPLAPVMEWIPRPNQGHSEVWICGWDRKQLLARIAGSFSSAGLNILSADVFTRGDSLVLDLFKVCTTQYEAVTDEKVMTQVAKRLCEALRDEQFDFGQRLEKAFRKRTFTFGHDVEFPSRIYFDNDSHPIYTLVEVHTPDRLGLLYNLLRAFGQAGVQIALSRIATENGAAIDTFYTTDAEGRKITAPKRLGALRRALENASEDEEGS
ncbi:MAG: [protein-PII] uridylyltransferase [Chthoniobacteraceae bacterium]